MNIKAKAILKTFSIIITVFLGLIVLFNIACTIKRHVTGKPCETVFGMGSAVVVSGSMEPALAVNDFIIIVKCEEYNEEDIVTYAGNNSAITHRIIAKRTDENGNIFYTTKGDNNNIADGEIPAGKIIGKVVLAVPNVGVIQTFISQPVGFLTVTLIAGAIILVPELICKGKEKEEMNRNEKD